MAFLERPRIKELVKAALKEVADFNGDIENYTFDNFSQYHKVVFMSHLKTNINKATYYDSEGHVSGDRFYDVPLSLDTFSNWRKMSHCINFIEDNQGVFSGSRKKLQL